MGLFLGSWDMLSRRQPCTRSQDMGPSPRFCLGFPVCKAQSPQWVSLWFLQSQACFCLGILPGILFLKASEKKILESMGSFFFLIFNWSIVDLQCFRCTAKWFIYIYILFQILFHCRLLQDIEYSSLCYTVGPFWLSISWVLFFNFFCLLALKISSFHHIDLFPFSQDPHLQSQG